MSLPDPSTNDFMYLETGGAVMLDAKDSVVTASMDYQYLETGGFLGYHAPVVSGGAHSFLFVIGIVLAKWRLFG